eukprot:jgi/Ulvmu1/6278/UM028_0138.1
MSSMTGTLELRRPRQCITAMLCVLFTFVVMHCAHALGGQADVGIAVHSGDPTLPIVVPDAVLSGLLSRRALAALNAAGGSWAGGRRALLHGRRRAKNYTVCPTCTLISCVAPTPENFNSRCSGHCKRNRRLYRCTGSGAAANSCGNDDAPDPSTVPPDSLPSTSSVQVEATAPFIGCVNITGLPSGCPAAGNTGTRADGTSYRVLWTICEQHMYTLKCSEGANKSPFYPFGYCMCVVLITGSGHVQQAPCSLEELDGYSGPPLSDTGMCLCGLRRRGAFRSPSLVRVMTLMYRCTHTTRRLTCGAPVCLQK